MTLIPLDGRTKYREKYLDETDLLAPWFIFGHHSDSPETVDIASANGDVINYVAPEVALELIAARDAFLSIVAKHLSHSRTK